KKIGDPNIRNKIQKKYFEKSFECIELFAKLIVLRQNYAMHNNFLNYFEYKKNPLSIEYIKDLITNIITKIELRSRKEMEKISRELEKDGHNKKIDLHDIIYYHEKIKNQNKFKPNAVLQIIFEIIETN